MLLAVCIFDGDIIFKFSFILNIFWNIVYTREDANNLKSQLIGKSECYLFYCYIRIIQKSNSKSVTQSKNQLQFRSLLQVIKYVFQVIINLNNNAKDIVAPLIIYIAQIIHLFLQCWQGQFLLD